MQRWIPSPSAEAGYLPCSFLRQSRDYSVATVSPSPSFRGQRSHYCGPIDSRVTPLSCLLCCFLCVLPSVALLPASSICGNSSHAPVATLNPSALQSFSFVSYLLAMARHHSTMSNGNQKEKYRRSWRRFGANAHFLRQPHSVILPQSTHSLAVFFTPTSSVEYS